MTKKETINVQIKDYTLQPLKLRCIIMFKQLKFILNIFKRVNGIDSKLNPVRNIDMSTLSKNVSL